MHFHSMIKTIKFCIFLSASCLFGCPGNLIGEMPPTDRFYFPSALLQQEDHLYVLSSNFDRRYAGGTVLALNLAKIDEKLQQLMSIDKARKRVVKTVDAEIVTSSVAVPSFGESPQLSKDKSKLIFASRANSQLIGLSLDKDKLGCLATVPSEKLGQNCLDNSIVTQLPWSDPYDLLLFPSSNQNNMMGLIGYLAPLKREKIENDRDSLTKGYGELQMFTWEPDLSRATIGRTYLLEDFLKADEKPSSSDQGNASASNNAANPNITDKKQTRRISRLGGMRIVNDRFLFLGVEALVSYGDLISSKRNARLIWFDMNQFRADRVEPAGVGEINLTQKMAAESINGFDVLDRGNGSMSVYLIMENESTLVHVDLVPDGTRGFVSTIKGQTKLCERPSAIRMSPGKKIVLVACEKSSDLFAFDIDTLAIVGRGSEDGLPFGRGPVQIWFDERRQTPPYRAYVSYFEDGTIGVFDVDDAGQKRLMPVGRIGEQAPLNHPGGL